MRNELVVTGTDTQLLLSQTDDGTNTLFINGVEVPQSEWVGEGAPAKWTTAEGQFVVIGKVKSADGNLMLTRANNDELFVYDFVQYVPFDPKDISTSLVQLNERVTDLEESKPTIRIMQGSYNVRTDGEQRIIVPWLDYDGDGQDLIVDINGLSCIVYDDYMFSSTDDGKYIDFTYGLTAGSIVHISRLVIK